jgi:uncharacterized membrane protein YhhN
VRISLYASVALLILGGALAIAGIELGHPALTTVFKPLTTLILLTIVGPPTTRFAWYVRVGILLSLAGDVALLSDGMLAFSIGLGAFLLAHLAYATGAFSVGGFSPRVLVVSGVAIATTGFLLAELWPGAGGARLPIIIYSAAITTMVIAAWSTVGGPLSWAWSAAAGAVLFYVSDASLALNRFHRPIPHEAFLSLGVYWLGQLGIALAARGGLRATSAQPSPPHPL